LTDRPAAVSVEAMADPLILVAHGSPDPDWRRPLEALQARLAELAPDRPARVAYMDFLEPSVADVARELQAAGHTRAVVIAAFLSPGGRHIKRDIPELVRQVNADVDGIELRLVPGALGEDEAVVGALADAALRFANSSE
jgi:sirohydrochlorin cobaltochelatase